MPTPVSIGRNGAPIGVFRAARITRVAPDRHTFVQQIDMTLEREAAKPTIFQTLQTQCWHPHVRGLVKGGNGNYSHHRFENPWIDQ